LRDGVIVRWRAAVARHAQLGVATIIRAEGTLTDMHTLAQNFAQADDRLRDAASELGS
jgi:hypothetical protein